MTDHIDFVCALPEHQAAELAEWVTFHEGKWAYCPAGESDRHAWRATGGVSLDYLKRSLRHHPVMRVDRS